MKSHQIGKGAVTKLLPVILLSVSFASLAEEADKPNVHQEASIGTNPGQATYAGSDLIGGEPPMTIRRSSENWEMGFHGYLRAPMRFSFDNHPVLRRTLDDDGNPIRDPNTNLFVLEESGDRDWRFNMPNSTPDNSYPTWQFTNNLSGPWAEVLFSYGNSIATGNVSIASWNITDSGWRNFQSQLGIDQAWVTLNFPRAFGSLGGLKCNAGVFSNRYGTMGRYDAGVYDTYIFGRTHIAGETLTANLDVGDRVMLYLEHGFGAKTEVLGGNPKQEIAPNWVAGDNTYAWIPYVGQEGQFPAFVNHAHGGVLLHNFPLWKELWLNAHFMHSFTNSADQSETASANVLQQQDGKYIIAGAEAKFNGAVFGNLYLGFSTVKTDGLARMPDAVELLHSQGGWSFLKNYYGDMSLTITPDGDRSRDGNPNPGTGRVNTFAWQYTFSIARLVWHLHNKDFWGQGPDMQISFWGMFNRIRPDEDLAPYLKRWAEKKLKLGGEVMYTPLKYFGMGIRVDHLKPDLDYNPDDTERNSASVSSFAPYTVFSPKIRIKTSFVTHEELNLQYSRYFWSGDRSQVRSENPYESKNADRNAVMLSVNMWW